MDVRTTILLAAGLGLLIGLSLQYAMRSYPSMLGTAMRLWRLGVLLQAIGWMLGSLPPPAPDWLTIVAANALLSFALSKQVEAVRQFAGAPANPTLIYTPVLASAAIALWFTYAMPDARVRLVACSAVFCAQLLCVVVALLDWRQPRRRSHLLTAGAFFVFAIVLLARIAYELARADSGFDDPAASPLQAAVLGCAVFFPAVATLGFVLMCADRLNQELEHQARIDPLTGISNRRTLDDLAARALASAQRQRRPLAVLLADADHFKRINDAYGHEVGDDALRALAITLDCSLRSEDLLGRIGGEEFAIVLPDTDEASARISAERLRRAVEQTRFEAGGETVPLRISIGLAMAAEGDDFAALLRRADKAMYAAKRAGRNRVVEDSEKPSRSVVIEGNFAG
ncbi:MAG TPA: GGDEF domain-containing protein [Rudaea sp.]